MMNFLFKYLFHFGLNEPIKSLHKSFFPGGEFKGSLSVFMDYALQLSDSLFTGGATEEDRDAVLPRERTPAPEHAHKMADTPLWPGPIASVLVRAAGVPRSAALSAPSQELAESAPEPAPSQELTEFAPEAAPIQELTEFAQEAAPIQELTGFAPEAAPIQELTESGTPGPLLVPSGSPEPLLALSGSASSPLVPSSSAPPERPRDAARPEYPLMFAPPECLPEVVDFPFLGRSHPPVLTETPDPPWPMRSPDPSWLPEAPDLPWPLKLPASVPETKCALSASCLHFL